MDEELLSGMLIAMRKNLFLITSIILVSKVNAKQICFFFYKFLTIAEVIAWRGRLPETLKIPPQ